MQRLAQAACSMVWTHLFLAGKVEKADAVQVIGGLHSTRPYERQTKVPSMYSNMLRNM